MQQFHDALHVTLGAAAIADLAPTGRPVAQEVAVETSGTVQGHGRTTMIEKLPKRLLGAAAIGVIGLALGTGPVHAQGMERERVSAALDRLAARLSAVLADSGSRAFVAGRMEASKTKVIALGELVSAAGGEGATRLAQLAGQVRQIETALARAGAPVPRLDLKLPVPEHQGLLGTSATIYVLAAPLEDESEVETLRAYSNQQPVTLNAEEAPDIPMLVLIPPGRERVARGRLPARGADRAGRGD